MTNTFFAPGDATPDELIGGVERGLYAVSFGGGQVEPATGDFVFGVSEGYLIEGGKVTAPVRGATLVGNGRGAAVDRRDRRRPRDRHGLLRQGRPVRAGRGRAAARADPRAHRGRDRRVRLEDAARRAIEAALAAGRAMPRPGPRRARAGGYRVYDGEVESLSDAGGRGLGVRAFAGARSGYAYGTDLRGERGRGARRGAREAAEVADEDEHAGLPDENGSSDVDGLASPGLAAWSTERKVALLASRSSVRPAPATA